MNIRWLLGNFADPEFKLTRKQQAQVTRLAHKKYLSGWVLSWSTFAFVAAGYLALGFGGEPLAGLLASMGLRPAWMLSLAMICTATIVFAAWMYRYIYVKPVRRAMRELGYDVCVSCGYRLQGLDDTIKRCPECGAERQTLTANAKGEPS